MITLREFKTAAEMRAHYGAVRARIFGPPPPRILRPPAPPSRSEAILEAAAKAKVSTAEVRRQALADALALRREALAEIARVHNAAKRIIKACAAHFDVSVEDMVGEGRKHGPVLDARFVACFLLKDRYGAGGSRRAHRGPGGWAWIGRHMNRDHTTAIHACRRVENSPRLLEHAAIIKEESSNVEISHFVRVDPEAYTLKRTCRPGAEL